MGNLRSVSKPSSPRFPDPDQRRSEGAFPPAAHRFFPGWGRSATAWGTSSARAAAVPREYLAEAEGRSSDLRGMQLLFSGSEEFGRHEGIGFFPGNVVRSPGHAGPGRRVLKVPHMGGTRWKWSAILPPSANPLRDVLLFRALRTTPCRRIRGRGVPVDVRGAVRRGGGPGNPPCRPVPPEKSQGAGLRLLGNFGPPLCGAALRIYRAVHWSSGRSTSRGGRRSGSARGRAEIHGILDSRWEVAGGSSLRGVQPPCGDLDGAFSAAGERGIIFAAFASGPAFRSRWEAACGITIRRPGTSPRACRA